MTTADRIRNRRLELGLTQLEVAKRMGLTSKAAICKIEKQGDDVTLKNVERIAKALHCAPSFLMGWSDEKYDGEEYKDWHLTQNTRVLTFMSQFENLSDDQKILVENMIQALSEKK